MDNRNFYNTAQQNGYYPYYAAAGTIARPEAPSYMMPPVAPAAIIKGRPVSSFEEARVAQIDLDGSVAIFPDLGNKKIYTKRINADGTASLHTYILNEQTPMVDTEYATKEEFEEMKEKLEKILTQLAALKTTPAANKTPINF